MTKRLTRTRRAKRAFITGLSGQDGSYLAEFLLDKGYEVFGIVRRTSLDPLERIAHLTVPRKVTVLYGNMRDAASLQRALEIARPDEVYNLAAQSDVGVSFHVPEETFEINYLGLGRLVNEAIKVNPKARIYQASTSEMFGATPPPQNERSLFHPVSPYGESKLKAHQDFVEGYRKQHGIYICSGILFNHESPRRGERFVTRKVSISLAKIKLGLQERLELGNLSAKRDWGFAGDYVKAMWMMLQRDMPEDFVIATGRQHTVRDLVNTVAKVLGMEFTWSGKGAKEIARDRNGIVRVVVNPAFYRPSEVHNLLGDSRKAVRKLGWKPAVSFEELMEMIALSDLRLVRDPHRSS
jgi:GDPmannose 4,6-dehydratase